MDERSEGGSSGPPVSHNNTNPNAHGGDTETRGSPTASDTSSSQDSAPLPRASENEVLHSSSVTQSSQPSANDFLSIPADLENDVLASSQPSALASEAFPLQRFAGDAFGVGVGVNPALTSHVNATGEFSADDLYTWLTRESGIGDAANALAFTFQEGTAAGLASASLPDLTSFSNVHSGGGSLSAHHTDGLSFNTNDWWNQTSFGVSPPIGRLEVDAVTSTTDNRPPQGQDRSDARVSHLPDRGRTPSVQSSQLLSTRTSQETRKRKVRIELEADTWQSNTDDALRQKKQDALHAAGYRHGGGSNDSLATFAEEEAREANGSASREARSHRSAREFPGITGHSAPPSEAGDATPRRITSPDQVIGALQSDAPVGQECYFSSPVEDPRLTLHIRISRALAKTGMQR